MTRLWFNRQGMTLGEEFDFHGIIFWLIENDSIEYIEELYSNYQYAKAPFKSFHVKIDTIDKNY